MRNRKWNHLFNRSAARRMAAYGIAAGMLLTGCAGAAGEETKAAETEPAQEAKEIITEAAAVYPEEPEYKDNDERWDAESEKRQKLSQTFTEAYDAFAIETTAEILKDRKENTVYSPLSLYYALALAASGAEGETQEEMLDVLGMDNVEQLKEESRSSFEAFYHFPNEKNNKPDEWGMVDRGCLYTLTIANSLWADEDLTLKESFAENGAENFYADIFRADLQAQETADAKALWVKERTNGLIEPKAEPAVEDTLLSIINTVYFYDEWVNRFPEEETKEDLFTCTDGTEVSCDFMNMVMGSHGFRKGENYTESTLQLKNGSMTFYLPDEGVDVYQLAEDTESFEQMMNGDLESIAGKVTWKVPKFSYGSSLSLADMLKEIGMEDAFSAEADFSGISDDGPLFISSVQQDAHLGIDEKGVEGAAFTEMMFAGAALPKDEAEMILDRPFLYIVRNNGNIIFAGICEDPTAE